MFGNVFEMAVCNDGLEYVVLYSVRVASDALIIPRSKLIVHFDGPQKILNVVTIEHVRNRHASQELVDHDGHCGHVVSWRRLDSFNALVKESCPFRWPTWTRIVHREMNFRAKNIDARACE